MSHKFLRLVGSLFLALAVSFTSFSPALAAPPVNDNFANAEAIAALPFSATADVTDATMESDEAPYCSSMNKTVWYSFTPIENMALRADTLGTITGNVNIYLSSGPGILDLSLLGCSISDGSVSFYAEAGQTYYLQAGLDSWEVGNIQINLEQIFPPANDNFANAEAIVALPFTVTVDVTDATNEPDESEFCAYMPNTVWYSFTPTETMALRADTLGSAITGNVNIYSSSGYLGCSSFTGSVNIYVDAGKTYYFQAGSAEVGNIQINLEQIFPPANDNLSNAEAVTTLPFTTTVDLTDTTIEPSEISTCSVSQRTVWYSFTPTETIALRADTLGGATMGNVNIYLSSGPGTSDLTFLGCSMWEGSFTFFAEAGKTYYFQAGEVDIFFVGTIQFNLEQVFPPQNDNFATAQVIASLPFSATVDNTDATFEPGEPGGCTLVNGSTLWYKFTPPVNMSVRVDVSGSAVGAEVGIYTGVGFPNLTPLGCTSSSTSANFNLTAGTTYYLQLDSDFGNTGVLQLSLQQIFPPANDNFANAEVITTLPFSATVDNTDATYESGEPSLGCITAIRTVWYSFTPAQNMAVQVDMVGSATRGAATVFLSLGSGISNLTFLGCAILSNSVNFNFEAGRTYYFQVAQNDSLQTGSIQLNLRQVSPPAKDVTIDIKPGRFPNRIKLTRNVCRANDNLYVAILTTPTFNARRVDVSSIQLGDPNLSGKAIPLKGRITDVDRDHDKDMVLTFTLCGIATNGALNLTSTEMVLTGRTLEGVNFTGRDSVKVVR